MSHTVFARDTVTMARNRITVTHIWQNGVVLKPSLERYPANFDRQCRSFE